MQDKSNGSSNKSSMIDNGIALVGTVTDTVIGNKIASKINGTFSHYKKWTKCNYAAYSQQLEYTTGGKALNGLKTAGLINVATTTYSVGKSIYQGQYMGAFIDLCEGAACIGAGILIGMALTALMPVSAPAIAVGAIGVGLNFIVGNLINDGCNEIKRCYYGRKII